MWLHSYPSVTIRITYFEAAPAWSGARLLVPLLLHKPQVCVHGAHWHRSLRAQCRTWVPSFGWDSWGWIGAVFVASSRLCHHVCGGSPLTLCGVRENRANSAMRSCAQRLELGELCQIQGLWREFGPLVQLPSSEILVQVWPLSWLSFLLRPSQYHQPGGVITS